MNSTDLNITILTNYNSQDYDELYNIVYFKTLKSKENFLFKAFAETVFYVETSKQFCNLIASSRTSMFLSTALFEIMILLYINLISCKQYYLHILCVTNLNIYMLKLYRIFGLL